MSIIDNARAHFDRARASLISIEVPEWGGEDGPAIIYFYPVINIEERAKIENAMRSSAVRGMMTMLCYRARDAEGKRLFPLGGIDKYIREFDSEVVASAAARIIDRSAEYKVSTEMIEKE